MQRHFSVYIGSVWMGVYESNKVEGLELKFLDYLSFYEFLQALRVYRVLVYAKRQIAYLNIAHRYPQHYHCLSPVHIKP